jgi:hypothetical protein
VTHGIRDRFEDLQSKRIFDPADLAAGRAYVASYVSFIHYVEALGAAARPPGAGHYADSRVTPIVAREGHAGH